MRSGMKNAIFLCYFQKPSTTIVNNLLADYSTSHTICHLNHLKRILPFVILITIVLVKDFLHHSQAVSPTVRSLPPRDLSKALLIQKELSPLRKLYIRIAPFTSPLNEFKYGQRITVCILLLEMLIIPRGAQQESTQVLRTVTAQCRLS